MRVQGCWASAQSLVTETGKPDRVLVEIIPRRRREAKVIETTEGVIPILPGATRMLTLTRVQRQVLATLALLAGSVAPTAYVGWLAWTVNRPGHLRDLEIEVGRRLGFVVTLGGVRYPRPNETRLIQPVFRQEASQPESATGPSGQSLTEIVRAGSILVRGGAAGEIGLECEGLTLTGESPRQALTNLGALLQRLGARNETTRMGLTASRATIQLGPDALRTTVHDLVITVQPPLSVMASFRWSQEPASRQASTDSRALSTRCELSIQRHRTQDGLTTKVALKTAEGRPLPARALNLFFNADEWLGPAAQVDGMIVLSQQGEGDWSAELAGTLRQVDLTSLVGNHFGNQRISGRAELVVDHARWGERPGQGHGWIEARGVLTAPSGSIGAGLLRSLGSEMKFRFSRSAVAALGSAPDASTDISHDGLGVAFALKPDGEILVDGALGAEFPPGVVLVTPGGVSAMMSAPEGNANVRGLIKALFPLATAELLVPATAETQSLQRYLPVPPATSSGLGTGN